MTEPRSEPEGPFPIDPAALIRHARRIVGALPEPEETEYRRAVSAAYFALFHAVTLRAVELLVPGDAPRERYARVRAFSHSNVRRVAQWASGTGTPSTATASDAALARREARVRMVARALLWLNAERQRADYDHFAQFSRSRANRAINAAEEAVAVVTAPAFGASDGGRAFLRMLAAQLAARPPSDA